MIWQDIAIIVSSIIVSVGGAGELSSLYQNGLVVLLQIT